MGTRFNHIDTARGIAILLVILGHCCSSSDLGINRLLLSFHMPLFFFLSGVLAKPVTNKALLGGVFSKARKLLVPQITLSLTIILLKGSLWIAEGKSMLDFDYISCFCFWFLPVLFICSVCYMVVSAFLNLERKGNRVFIGMASLFVAIATVYTHASSNIVVVDWLIKTSVALFFYLCGSFVKEKVLKVNENQSVKRGLLLFTLLPLLILLSQANSMVLMYKNEYGYFPLFVMSSFVGIAFVIELSKRLVSVPFLIEAGKLSIAFYVWNFLFVGIMMRLIYRISQLCSVTNDYVITMTTFIISIMIIYAISSMTYKYVPIIYGIKAKKI